MGLASTRTVVFGTFSFMVFWVLAVFPSFKFLPIGRTAGAMAGAVLTVVCQVESPDKAYDSVNLPILGLLFGTMVVSVYLENANMFQYLGNLISWKSQGGKDLLCRICILSAILSALFTNDTSCLVFTEFVLQLCRQKNLPPKPFLIALATSANIGSTATPIGNPQNLVIAVQSGISFGRFLIGLLPSMLLGVLVNIILLLLVYWRQLSPVEDVEKGLELSTPEGESKGKGLENSTSEGQVKDQAAAPPRASFESGPRPGSGLGLRRTASDICDTHSFPRSESKIRAQRSQVLETHQEDFITRLPKSISTHGSCSSQEVSTVVRRSQSGFDELEYGPAFQSPSPSPFVKSEREIQSRLPPKTDSSSCIVEEETIFQKTKRKFRKCTTYGVLAAMLAALLYGLDLSWSALTAAVALIILDFRDARLNLEKVSYPLLVFFTGMFITVDGFNQTGIPGTFWDSVEPHARMNSVTGVIVLALVVIVLSNAASNVPTVLLLGSRVSLSASKSGVSVTKAWLMLAWTSTIAGNLTLVGSAANLIVSEQAKKAQFFGYDLTFGSHLIFGFPSTLIIAALGLPLIKG